MEIEQRCLALTRIPHQFLARPRPRPTRSKGIMVALGAALTGRSGLATAGPKFVKGLGHRLGVLSIPRWFLVRTCIYWS
jgi:hypothetical protein